MGAFFTVTNITHNVCQVSSSLRINPIGLCCDLINPSDGGEWV